MHLNTTRTMMPDQSRCAQPHTRSDGIYLGGDVGWSISVWRCALHRLLQSAGITIQQNRIAPQTRDCTIWAGTSDRLARFERDSFRPVTLGERVTLLSQSSLTSDRQGSLYAGTSTGLWMLQSLFQHAVRLYPQTSSKTHTEVYGVYVDPKGAVWFGCD